MLARCLLHANSARLRLTNWRSGASLLHSLCDDPHPRRIMRDFATPSRARPFATQTWEQNGYLATKEESILLEQSWNTPAVVRFFLKNVSMILTSDHGQMGNLANHDGSAYDQTSTPVQTRYTAVEYEYSTDVPHHHVYLENKESTRAHLLLVPQQLSKCHSTITIWPDSWEQFLATRASDSGTKDAVTGDTSKQEEAKVGVLLVIYGPAVRYDVRQGRDIVKMHHDRLVQLSESLENCNVQVTIVSHASEAHTAATVGLEWNKIGDRRVRVVQVIASRDCSALQWQNLYAHPTERASIQASFVFWIGGIVGVGGGLYFGNPYVLAAVGLGLL
jgi:hypothetical protein